ncbi:hypothetical protein OIU76_007474 [Salix suchowensis]|nr:hypothetical protein OIU76_007474 [Salix suchowensis]
MGVWWLTPPTANTIAAAEHGIDLPTAMARNIAQADVSMKAGKWQRSKYVGVSLMGKTLAVMGFGKVGSEVARRAKGLGMHVIAHDPYAPADRARAIGVGLFTFEEAISIADFISLQAVVGALKGELAATAVNTPMVPAEVRKTWQTGSATGWWWRWCTVNKDDLCFCQSVFINLVNADFTAKQRGLRITEEHILLDGSPENPLELIQVQIANVESKFATAISDSGEIKVEGRVKDRKPHLTMIGSFGVDASMEGSLILCRQVDQPGMIGSVGNIFGEENVNVSFMSVGRITP